ncbi:MAG: hypothetical protein ACI9BD_000022 [Candidatus Marinamargulisbacteria bacterium]|jgi:hypothetical protein
MLGLSRGGLCNCFGLGQPTKSGEKCSADPTIERQSRETMFKLKVVAGAKSVAKAEAVAKLAEKSIPEGGERSSLGDFSQSILDASIRAAEAARKAIDSAGIKGSNRANHSRNTAVIAADIAVELGQMAMDGFDTRMDLNTLLARAEQATARAELAEEGMRLNSETLTRSKSQPVFDVSEPETGVVVRSKSFSDTMTLEKAEQLLIADIRNNFVGLMTQVGDQVIEGMPKLGSETVDTILNELERNQDKINWEPANKVRQALIRVAQDKKSLLNVEQKDRIRQICHPRYPRTAVYREHMLSSGFRVP